MPPVAVLTPFSVALHVQAFVEVLEGPVEMMAYFIHTVNLQVYRAVAEGSVSGTSDGCGLPEELLRSRGDGSTYCVLKGSEDSRRTTAAGRGVIRWGVAG